MPIAIVASIIGSEIAGALLAEAVLSGLISSTVLGLIGSGIGFVVGSLLRGAIGGSSKPQQSNPVATALNRTITVRQPIAPWQVIYGEARVGGVITFAFVDSTKTNLYLVITFAGHLCEAIGDIYFNDELVTLNGSYGTGKWANAVYLEKSLGDEAGQPFSTLVGATGGAWSDAHRQTGRAKIYVLLAKNRDVFPTGVPNVTAVIKGRKVLDPRQSPAATEWSNNAALCACDYLTNTEFGFGAVYASEIDESQLVAAANACDERVVMTGETATFDASLPSNTCTFDAANTDWGVDPGHVSMDASSQIEAGLAVRFSTTGALPAELSIGTTYYLAKFNHTVVFNATTGDALWGSDAKQFTVSATQGGAPIAISGAGSGVHTISEYADHRALHLEAQKRMPRLGDGLRFAVVGSPGALPGGLLEGVTYYAIPAIDKLYVAATLAEALAGTRLNVTDAGSGAFHMVYYDSLRYICNGAVKADSQPKEILGNLLAAMIGKAVNVGGKWFLFAGVYEAPSITLDEGDLAGPIRVQSMISRRENANGVKGTFIDPSQAWQPTSFPALASAQYLAEDGGERVWKDLDLTPFVTASQQAQRIAKIALLSLRQGLTVQVPCKLSAYAAMTGRTVAMNNTKFGWNAKAFEVIASKFAFNDDGTLGVDLSLRETAAAVYDWSTADEVGSADLAPNSDLPSIWDELAITGLTASSGTADLIMLGDGTVISAVRLRFNRPLNPFIVGYEYQRAVVADQAWSDIHAVALSDTLMGSPEDTELFVRPVEDGEVITLRVRARSGAGNAGEWAYVFAHTVVGKTAPPSDPSGFVAAQSGPGTVLFSVNSIEDADLKRVEVRLLDLDDTNWANGIPICNILKGITATTAAVIPGTWTFLARSFDTSENPSTNTARYDMTVSADGYTTIVAREFAPDWVGTLSNFVVSVSGALVPDSTKAASQHTNAELFEQYVPYPQATCIYTAPEIDKNIDGTVRVYGDIVSSLGRGVLTGGANPTFEIDARASAGSYDGYEAWAVGLKDFRYLSPRIELDTSTGRAVITGFAVTFDALSRTESGTYTTPGGGSVAVSFGAQFHIAPAVQVTPQGSGDVSASFASVTTTGFTGYFKTAGAAGAGTANYDARGV